jgi:O-acetyl-ADP-ribose deacetylase (regulator of RNase III)
MSQAPLVLGSAFSTTAGQLSESGIQAIIHVVIAESLGAKARVEVVRRAISTALRMVEERRYRTIAMPLLVAGAGTGQVAPDVAASILVEEIVAHLRRNVATRLERIYLVSRSETDVALLDKAIRLAREHIWGQPA